MEAKHTEEPSAGAMRAALEIAHASMVQSIVNQIPIAQIIDKETGLKQLEEALWGMMVFYGMDRERSHEVCELTWKAAEKAIAKVRGTP